MAEGYDDDDEGKDTQILPAVETPPKDLEGTVEMDRKALLASLQADAQTRNRTPSDEETFEGEYKPDETERIPKTIQMSAVEEDTTPSKTQQVPAVNVNTQHYQVPESVMEKLREAPDDLHTLEVSMELIEEAKGKSGFDRTTAPYLAEDLGEFEAVIDADGNIPLPQRLLKAKFRSGARVHVVMRLMDR